jgi:hypothetical protein
LRDVKEGTGEITVFFGQATHEQTRLQFREYVYSHLITRAVPGSVTQQKIIACPECDTPLTYRQIKMRIERGYDWISCNVCETKISLLDQNLELVEEVESIIPEMDRAADIARNEAARVTILHGKKATSDFDVFISYSHKDKRWVTNWLLPQLEKQGINPYIDFLHFEVGVPALVNMEMAIKDYPQTILVFTPNWIASEWTNFESLLLQSQDPGNIRNRLLPIMLANCDLPSRLGIFTYADFTDPLNWENEIKRIIKAINDKTLNDKTVEE